MPTQLIVVSEVQLTAGAAKDMEHGRQPARMTRPPLPGHDLLRFDCADVGTCGAARDGPPPPRPPAAAKDQDDNRLPEETEAERQEITTEPDTYRKLFEMAPDAYLFTDLAGTIQEANAAAARLFRTAAMDLTGTPVLEFLPQKARREVAQRVAARAAAGEADEVDEWEGQLLPRSGDVVTVSFRVGGGGQAGGLMWLLRDVSESTRGREMLYQSEQRLKMLHTVKDTFLQSVSHDLRNPLAAVIGLAQTLAREDANLDRDETLDLLQRILSSGYQMKALLTDLLDLDRLSGGDLGISNDPVDLDQLAADVTRQLADSGYREVELRSSGLVATTDRAVLERIMVNLMTNALRYTPAGSRVSFGFEAVEAHNLMLVVEDDGPGVHGRLKEAIFEPFFRTTTPGAEQGSGMGLTLVERFAGFLGGRAWVEDRLDGRGASFRVLIPNCLSGS
ncbi:MAG: ATP-binding protein [Actinomycetota bacterium]|nr:ATP-binding protein [Actinomycetota bacterium]